MEMIYNSRNYSILLNSAVIQTATRSTTVEIILYYLTIYQRNNPLTNLQQ